IRLASHRTTSTPKLGHSNNSNLFNLPGTTPPTLTPVPLPAPPPPPRGGFLASTRPTNLATPSPCEWQFFIDKFSKFGHAQVVSGLWSSSGGPSADSSDSKGVPPTSNVLRCVNSERMFHEITIPPGP